MTSLTRTTSLRFVRSDLRRTFCDTDLRNLSFRAQPQNEPTGDNMSRAILLRVVLITTGVPFCLTGFGIVLPEAGLKAMLSCFGGTDRAEELWPTGALFIYALRASCVAYLWIGAVLLVAAANPTRHKTQINIAICGLSLTAVVCFVTGMTNGVPTLWYLSDSLYSLIVAVLLVAFRPKRENK